MTNFDGGDRPPWRPPEPPAAHTGAPPGSDSSVDVGQQSQHYGRRVVLPLLTVGGVVVFALANGWGESSDGAPVTSPGVATVDAQAERVPSTETTVTATTAAVDIVTEITEQAPAETVETVSAETEPATTEGAAPTAAVDATANAQPPSGIDSPAGAIEEAIKLAKEFGFGLHTNPGAVWVDDVGKSYLVTACVDPQLGDTNDVWQASVPKGGGEARAEGYSKEWICLSRDGDWVLVKVDQGEPTATTSPGAVLGGTPISAPTDYTGYSFGSNREVLEWARPQIKNAGLVPVTDDWTSVIRLNPDADEITVIACADGKGKPVIVILRTYGR